MLSDPGKRQMCFLAVPNSYTWMQRLKAFHYGEGQGGTIIQTVRYFGQSSLEGILIVAIIYTYEKAIIRRDMHIHKVFSRCSVTISCAIEMKKVPTRCYSILCPLIFFHMKTMLQSHVVFLRWQWRCEQPQTTVLTFPKSFANWITCGKEVADFLTNEWLHTSHKTLNS